MSRLDVKAIRARIAEIDALTHRDFASPAELRRARGAMRADMWSDVKALCDRVEALEAALRRAVPVLDRVVSAACAKVAPDYAETLDALDDARAALGDAP